MPFKKGHKLSKGRPQGSKNKTTDVNKQEIQELFYDVEEMKRDFQTLDAYKKFDIRMKAMNHFYSKPTTEIQIESKPWADQKFILDIGEEDLSEEEKKRIYFEYGENPPLFIDND